MLVMVKSKKKNNQMSISNYKEETYITQNFLMRQKYKTIFKKEIITVFLCSTK